MARKPAQIDLLDGSVQICTETKDPDKSGLEAMEDRLYRSYVTKSGYVADRLAEIGLPNPGEQYRLVTRRSFNAIEMLQVICRREKIIDLKMAIYSINYNAALILVDLIDRGCIDNVEILMSNLRNHAHREKEEVLKKLFIAHPKIRLFYCSSHAKLMSCRTDHENYYTIEGSGNLAYNSRIEQYVIDNDQPLYEFQVTWMREIKEFLSDRREFEDCST